MEVSIIFLEKAWIKGGADASLTAENEALKKQLEDLKALLSKKKK